MPSKTIADEIGKRLAPDEKAEDAEYLFDTLFGLRAGSTLTTEQNATLTGGLLCFLVPAKPPNYKAEMQQFRLQFAGVATDSFLQRLFRQSVLPLAITLDEPETNNIQWDASLFFKRPETAEAEASSGLQVPKGR